MNPRLIAATLLAGLATSASAQTGTATYSIAFGSAGGTNNIALLPGQSTSVFINVSFTPGVGQPYQGGTVAGLSDGGFSISSSGANPGLWSGLTLPNPWGAQAVGGVGVNPGTPSGTGGVNGVIWGYGFLFGLPHPFPQNPATVWQGVYTCGPELSVINLSLTGLAPTGVFIGLPGGGLPTVVNYNSDPGIGGTILRIPAPATLGALSLGAMTLARRRR